ncbi:HigA family addiction module antitoxin [Legionella spiritensis]|uniref:Plasmid maintenance system antidote protein n=2 Tax=Legionella spiritensis TaxID=452 RepID=A0A0W0Z4N7_LEGSP|nr:HigA family addiction module antitoxin [Legionella spiritensis]KTD63886.1 plasmid maintenance system antidote protein [Legionella spiritensis]SNV36264.1 plasmid maintenance system antidote protein [Legionella spiritensis]
MMKLKNIHPGEILLEEFLLPMEISQNKLANDIGVSPRRINEIVHGKRSVTADTDLRLSRALGTSEGFWLGLQADYDLEEKKASLKSALGKIKSLVSSEPEIGVFAGR